MKKINIAVIVIVLGAILYQGMFDAYCLDALRPPLASEAIPSARQNADDL